MLDRPLSIALDIMSGDAGPQPALVAAANCLSRYPELRICLVGKEEFVDPFVSKHREFGHRLSAVVASDIVGMADKPAQVLKNRSRTSMAVALELAKGDVDACVSAGNTGALMLLARAIVKTHPEVDRPAIIKRIPSPYNCCYMVDLGANVDCRAEHLYQFAVMGTAMVEAMENLIAPRVVLLNIGKEENKGNEQIRLASRMLHDAVGVNYDGFVEADELFTTTADVVVCDGLVGNVALKTGEGLGRMLLERLDFFARSGWYGRMLTWAAYPLLRRVATLMDPARHNGASFAGLTRTVVKCHGNSQVAGFESAIAQAMLEAVHDVPRKIHDRLDELI